MYASTLMAVAAISSIPVVASVPTAPASVPATAGLQNTLSSFVNGEFKEVGKTCLPAQAARRFGFLTGRRSATPASYVPSDVQGWSVLKDHWDAPVEVQSAQSLNAVFAQVFEVIGEGEAATRRPLAQRLGVAWPSTDRPILYEHASNAQRQHNCVTMLGSNAQLSAGLSAADLRAAFTATTTRADTETAFAYAGVMVSPIAAVLGLNTTTVDAPTGVSSFRIASAIWQWYRRTKPAPGAHLQIRNQVEGLAVYRVIGLTQTALLTAEGAAGLNVPFFSPRATVSGNTQTSTTSSERSYAVAYWVGESDFIDLPDKAQIERHMRSAADFSATQGQNLSVQSNSRVEFSADLADLPSNYCRTAEWGLAAPQQHAGEPSNLGEASDLRVAPAPGTPGSCRFTVSVTPKSTSRSVVGAVIAVRAAEDTSGPPLLESRRYDIPDYRADLVIGSGDGPRFVAFTAASTPLNYMISYSVRSKHGRSITLDGATRVTVSCQGRPERAILLQTTDVEVPKSNDRISLKVPLPGDLIDASTSSVSCTLGGTTHLKGGNTATEELQFPSYDISVTRSAATPLPAPSVTPLPSAAPAA